MTVANAAPDLKPNNVIAVATDSSKKLLAPIKAYGPATQCFSRTSLFNPYASIEFK